MSSAINDKLLVAVVDDDPIFRDLTCAIISTGKTFIPVPAASGDELFDVLKTHDIACILLDFNLGDETGLSIKKKLDLDVPDAPPVIMLTGDGRERTAIEAFRMGVSDYLPKLGMEPEKLLSMISTIVGDAQARLKAKIEQTRLEQASLIDPVTGLSGQVQLDHRLAHLAQLGQADRSAYTLMTIELLQYQSIVEHYGLGIAEQALRAFGDKLKDLRQADDLCGRYAEGTFLFIKHFRADPATVDDLCHRLSDYLSFTTETPCATLKLSARVDIAVCGSDTPSADPWSRLAAPSKTMPRPARRSGLPSDAMVDRDRIGATSETVGDPMRRQPPQRQAWVYAPS